jgi:hypothetical protein
LERITITCTSIFPSICSVFSGKRRIFVPIAIDIDNTKLEFAKTIGASYTINAREIKQVFDVVINLTGGGVNFIPKNSWQRSLCWRKVVRR